MESDIGYITGFINANDSVVVIGASEQLEEKDVAHSFVGVWKDKKWVTWEQDFYIVTVDAGPAAHARASVLVGMTGEVFTINDQGKTSVERIATGKNAPNRLRTLHEVRAIGASFYVVGMRRQVFRRNITGGAWQKIDEGVFVPDSSRTIAGFLSVDGFGESEIYAVGYSGEIWLYDGKKWRQIDSPTNARLESVRCIDDREVLICGESGLILRGRGDSWSEVPQDETEEDLLSLAWLGDSAYFATEDGTVLTLKSNRIQALNIKTSKSDEPTTGVLDSNGKRLLSIGESDILVFDGKRWQSVSDPPFEV
jgi:photosystem II stability/assembly factor-like uncharacterized protein